MITDTEHFFMCLWAIYVFFWKMPIQVLYQFLIRYIILLLFYEFFIHFVYQPFIRFMNFKYFLPSGRLPLHFVDHFLCCAEAFQFDLDVISHLVILLLVSNSKNHCQDRCQGGYHLCFLLRSFRIFWAYVHVSNLFSVKCKTVVQYHYFACYGPVFPTPLIKEIVFFPSYILDSFVMN